MAQTLRSQRKSARTTSVRSPLPVREIFSLRILTDICFQTNATVFFGHLTPDVEQLRYQHTYHPVPIEQKCPELARVLDAVSANTFGGDGVYEPLLNTVRQGDYYILTDDFDSCTFFLSLFLVDDIVL